MQRRIMRVAILSALAATVLGCESRPPSAAEPVSLPPTRVPATVTPVVRPSPTPTRALPSATPSPEPTVTTEVHPTAEAGNRADATPTVAETEEPLVPTPIGQLSAAMVGQEVTVEGTVLGTESFSGGFKFTLDDGTGQVTLVMWHDVYDDCWAAPGLNLGAQVQATGEVTEYEGQLQIQPPWGGAVTAREPVSAWAESRPIGSLSGADEGRRVMIDGTVVRTEGLSSAVKVFVRDDSGEILVLIWRNVLDRIPDNVGLGTPDSRVQVVGTVQMYRGDVELVPTLPVDVRVLEIP
jgi:DNA/RNA endonuclease YhcR with UshA esterase domain